MSGPGRILRPTVGNNAPRAIGGGSGKAPYRFVRPMGPNQNGMPSGQCTTRYFDASGTQLWIRDHTATIRDVAIDSSGNIYECGDADSTGVTLRKRDNLGNELWTAKHGAQMVMCALTPSGGVVAGGAAGTGGYTIRQYASDGTLEWSATTAYDVVTLDCDLDGNVIANSLNSPSLAAFPMESWIAFFNPDGTLDSESDYAYNDTITDVGHFRVITGICFNRQVSHPYADIPQLRFLSAVSAQYPSSPSWWIASENGNTGVSGFAGFQVAGSASRVANRGNSLGLFPAGVSYVIGAQSDAGTLLSVTNSTLGGYSSTDQLLGSGSLALAIAKTGDVFTASTTRLRVFTAQSPVYTGVIDSGHWTTTPWNPVASRENEHNGTVYGVDVNDSGLSVLGGIVADV